MDNILLTLNVVTVVTPVNHVLDLPQIVLLVLKLPNN